MSNLLLLCIEHSYEVDSPPRAKDFPADELRRWKMEQLKDFDSLGQGWVLSREELAEASAASFSVGNLTAVNSLVSLGGGGGQSPGAGGGGGGASGVNTRGGDGGPGGSIRLAGEDGRAPGAGGGGAGAVGPGAVGASGGGGGEYVEEVIGPEEIERLNHLGLDHVEITVGESGRGQTTTGEGNAGGDTAVNFVAADGTVLKSIRAKGGQGGKPGVVGDVQPVARQVTATDISNGLRICSLLLADCAHLKNGMLSLLSGGWEHYEVPSLPFDVVWPLSCSIDAGRLGPETLLEIFVVVRDPTGNEVGRQRLVVSTGPDRFVKVPIAVVAVAFRASMPGVWSIELASGGIQVGQLPIEIKTRSGAPTS